MDFEVILTRIEWGGRQAIQAVINDITKRKKAEAKLRESQARLRESEARFNTAFKASPVLMSIATLNDGRFVEVNDAFIQALGLNRADVVGRNALELSLWVKEEDRTNFYERLARERSLRDIEAQGRGRDGTVHTMQISRAATISARSAPSESFNCIVPAKSKRKSKIMSKNQFRPLAHDLAPCSRSSITARWRQSRPGRRGLSQIAVRTFCRNRRKGSWPCP